MEASRAPVGRIGVGKVINEAFSIYGQNLGALLGSAVVVFVVVGLVSGLLQNALEPSTDVSVGPNRA